MKYAPEYFAPLARADVDLMWGTQETQPAAPEQVELDDAFLVFVRDPGAKKVLDWLIHTYLAAPVFDSARDANRGFERNGEANVVRKIVERMERAMRAREQK